MDEMNYMKIVDYERVFKLLIIKKIFKIAGILLQKNTWNERILQNANEK